MKELLPALKNWIASGKRVVLARVIKTWGSSPRPAGSCMIISENLEMAGSVSGGCIESAVLKEAKNIFEGGAAKTLSFGVTDEDAWTVGLSCGGKVDVFIQPWFPEKISKQLVQFIEANKSFTLVTSVGEGELKNAIVESTLVSHGDTISGLLIQSSILALNSRIAFQVVEDDGECLIHSFPRRSRIIIIGAAHITSSLVKLSREFDFETIVIDPRGVFARNTKFIDPPDQIIEKYPSEVLSGLNIDSHTYVVILSHDPKIDDDALRVLLRTNVAYIGALGSKKNHEKRTSRLMEFGFKQNEVDRINAPIGVDINAVGANEIALSILAAIIQTRNENIKK